MESGEAAEVEGDSGKMYGDGQIYAASEWGGLAAFWSHQLGGWQGKPWGKVNLGCCIERPFEASQWRGWGENPIYRSGIQEGGPSRWYKCRWHWGHERGGSQERESNPLLSHRAYDQSVHISTEFRETGLRCRCLMAQHEAHRSSPRLQEGKWHKCKDTLPRRWFQDMGPSGSTRSDFQQGLYPKRYKICRHYLGNSGKGVSSPCITLIHITCTILCVGLKES